MNDEADKVFRPRQKMQTESGAAKGSAFAIEAANAKAQAEKTARLRAERKAKEALEPKAEPNTKKPSSHNGSKTGNLVNLWFVDEDERSELGSADDVHRHAGLPDSY